MLVLKEREICRHQQYIGKVKHAVFQTQGSGRKRVIVGTEEDAIASLNLRTGEVCTCHDQSHPSQKFSFIFCLRHLKDLMTI